MNLTEGRIRRFVSFLSHLQDEKCGSTKVGCEYKISTCPVAKALVSAGYRDFKWCARCDGYPAIAVKVEAKKSKSKTQVVKEERYETLYAGGYIIGVHLDGDNTAAYACNCEAGRAFSRNLGGIRQFDFSENPDDCFGQHCHNLIAWNKRRWEAVKAKETSRRESAKERLRQSLLTNGTGEGKMNTNIKEVEHG